jgi:hypothetical protein
MAHEAQTVRNALRQFSGTRSTSVRAGIRKKSTSNVLKQEKCIFSERNDSSSVAIHPVVSFGQYFNGLARQSLVGVLWPFEQCIDEAFAYPKDCWDASRMKPNFKNSSSLTLKFRFMWETSQRCFDPLLLQAACCSSHPPFLLSFPHCQGWAFITDCPPRVPFFHF